MSIDIREAEGKRDRAGNLVRELEGLIKMRKENGWDTDTQEAELVEARRVLGALSRTHDVAYFKEHGASQSNDPDNIPGLAKSADASPAGVAATRPSEAS